MMNSFNTTYTCSNSMENENIKQEPICEEEAHQILSNLPEPPIDVKPSVICKEEVIIVDDDDDDQKNCEPQTNNTMKTPFVREKTLVLINGILYFIEKIPDPVIQAPVIQNQIQKTVDGNANVKDPSYDPAPCPHCGKMLKHRSNLNLHMQVCVRGLFYKCKICPYKTKNEMLLSLHTKNCARYYRKKKSHNSRTGFLSTCLKCNVAEISCSSKCKTCGSLKRWQCIKCNKQFENVTKAQYHYRTECNPTEYYHCPKCDYRSSIKYRTKLHVRNSHPDLYSDDFEISLKKTKVAINESKHVCTKCGKNFETTKGLNKHLHLCKKTRNSSEKVEDFRKLISPHCKKCDKDIELEESQIGFQTNCSDCSSTLEYQCKICQNFHQNYDTMAKHLKTNCNKQPEIKCEECNFTTYSKALLNLHQKKSHGDISATCTNCGSYFKSLRRFERHVRYCESSNILRCELCPYITWKEEYLKNHMSNIHDKLNSPDLSSIVNKARCSFGRIRPHIQTFCVKCRRRQVINYRVKYCKICKETLQLRCITCDKMYTIDDADACKHVKTYLEQISLECKLCGKGFWDKKKIQLHEQWCGKTKNYNCKLCEYSSPYVSHLRKHEQQAHPVKPQKQSRVEDSNQINENDAEICYISSGSESNNDTKKINGNAFSNQESDSENQNEPNSMKYDIPNSMANQESDSENQSEPNAMKYDIPNSMANGESDIESKNEPNAVDHENSSDKKLHLQCKVVLTRLII